MDYGPKRFILGFYMSTYTLQICDPIFGGYANEKESITETKRQ